MSRGEAREKGGGEFDQAEVVVAVRAGEGEDHGDVWGKGHGGAVS